MYLKFPIEHDLPGDRVHRGPRPLPRRDRVPIRIGKIKQPLRPAIPSKLAGVARFAKPVARLVPGLGVAIVAYEVVDQLLDQLPSSNGKGSARFLPAGWKECFDCGRRPDAPDYGGAQTPSLTGWRGTGGTGCSLSCLSGQSAGSPSAMLGTAKETFDIPDSIGGMYLQDTRTTSQGVVRARQDRQIVRVRASPGSRYKYHPVTFFAQPNPNVIRGLPAPAPFDPHAPQPEPSPPPAKWQWSNTPPGSPPPRLHTRSSPPRRTKEKKVLSRAAKFGVMGWKLLDNVAELTEIVRSFYDALPEAVRKKAKCGDGINIGQYGTAIDVCMMQTLYKHWDKVDPADAFMNLAKNAAEDMTIGQFHKFIEQFLPPDPGLARTIAVYGVNSLEAEAAIAGQLKRLFTFLGLED